MSKAQKVRIILLYVIYAICVLEIFISLIIDFFPLINYVLRCLIIVLQIKTLRHNWLKIFRIIVKAKSVLFILLFNMCVFALIASLLFETINDFRSFFTSMYNIFVLLNSCNYPDIMLKTFSISKFSMLFFVIFLISNYIIIQQLLKVLYYTDYLELNKQKTEKYIALLRSGGVVLDTKNLKEELYKITKKNSLTRDEFYKLLYLIDINVQCTKSEQFDASEITYSGIKRRDTFLREHGIIYYLRLKRVEIVINLVNLILVGFLLLQKKEIFLCEIQLAMFLYFVIEFAIYLKVGGITRIVPTKIMRTLYWLICLAGTVTCITYLVMEYTGNLTPFLIKTTQTVIIFRSFRFFILLNRFSEFKYIFVTLQNLRTISIDLLFTLYSLILMFSTISSLILGGKIKEDQFVGTEIPVYYHYVNFNDFASSFLACFALMMLNNINIVIDALATPVGDWIKPYFTIFYLFGILILLNIFQTYILDMYIAIKKIKKLNK
jgi:hypothetical protein